MTSLELVLAAAAILTLPRSATAGVRLRGLRVNEPVAVVPEAIASDPLALAAAYDLLAACLRAGLPMSTAAAAVSVSAPPPLAGSLRRASDLLALGADPSTAWEDAAANTETESLARTARRSARSGAPVAAAMAELAAAQRVSAEDTAAARAERAGVLMSGPLGLCFLPAFICLGIVPVVIGLASRTLGGGLL